MRAEVQLAWKTQAGHRHQVEGLGNEDAAWVTDDHPFLDAVLVVADGMGGHPRPREASESAVAAARKVISEARIGSAADVPAALSAALARAQAAVQGLRTQPTGKPPGTTLSIAAVCEGVLYVVHVGDGSVFVMREGAARCIAGGEDRRAGNRPQQFLGQPQPLEPETARLPLQAGDRLLLCTDGLTRYFNELGRGALEGVLGRPGVPVAAISNQLTAHSRPDSYDDDTTVAVAEVTGLVDTPRPARSTPAVTPVVTPPDPAPSPRNEPEMPQKSPLSLVLPLVAGAALLAGGFYAGRLTAPAPAPPTSGGPALREAATPEQLSGLPPGNVVLFDPLNRRLFALATRPVKAEEGVSKLQGFRVGADGRLAEAGQFQLDPARGELRLPGGGKVPVEIDHAGASLRVLRGGVLQVDSRPPGATISLDGRTIGPTPQRITVPAGRYRLRVEGRTWARETDVDVPAGGLLSLSLGR